jgi:hypothetical protein
MRSMLRHGYRSLRRPGRIAFLTLLACIAAFPQGVPHFNTLTWTLSTTAGVTGQKVYRGTVSGGPYINVATLSATTTTFADSATTQGQNHCYVLTALAGTNESIFSGEVCGIDAGTNVNPQTGLGVVRQ